jgi:predicted metal-dependent hydrolase
MKKSDRISALVGELGADPAVPLDPFYAGYFTCFNARQYYEAHDVLEHLWLRTKGEDRLFFQGLIQVAGAFVHLQKQFLHPAHPKHATRLRPAVRLFRLAARNLEPYGPAHRRLDVAGLLRLCRHLATEIEASDFARNPWTPARAPQLQHPAS